MRYKGRRAKIPTPCWHPDVHGNLCGTASIHDRFKKCNNGSESSKQDIFSGESNDWRSRHTGPGHKLLTTRYHGGHKACHFIGKCVQWRRRSLWADRTNTQNARTIIHYRIQNVPPHIMDQSKGKESRIIFVWRRNLRYLRPNDRGLDLDLSYHSILCRRKLHRDVYVEYRRVFYKITNTHEPREYRRKT